MATRKFSFDVTERNRKALERRRRKTGAKYGPTINLALSCTLDANPDVARETTQFFKNRVDALMIERQYAGQYELAAIDEKIQDYTDLISLMTQPTPTSDIQSISNYQYVHLKNGILQCPDDWIVINADGGKECMYASAIECRNASKYGVPHLVYLSVMPCAEFAAKDIQQIYALCAKAAPNFGDILNKQVTPIMDESQPGKLINAADYYEAPQVGIFHIFRMDDPDLPDGYEHPYGARIIASKD